MAKFNEITIRVLNTSTQKVKFVFPSIANNKHLMKNMGFVISDPQYDAKMEAFKNRKPFGENGQVKEPIKELTPIVQSKNETVAEDKPKVSINTEGEPKKRTRRTKEQIKADNLKKPVTA